MSESLQAAASQAASHVMAGHYEEALALYEQLIPLSPQTAILHYGYGLALQKLKRDDAALTAFDKVIELMPDMAYAHYAIALQALRMGDFARGWREYEWRFHFNDDPKDPYRQLPASSWSIDSAHNPCVFLWPEQGFGDMLQFCRYIPIVAANACKVYVAVHPSMRRLFAQSFPLPNVTLLSMDDPIPDYDSHSSLMSLPLVCQTDDVRKIPARPYLQAPPNDAAQWREKIAALNLPATTQRVGIAWAGGMRPHHPEAAQIDAQRSMPLEVMSVLSSVQGIQFFNLQKGEPAAQIHTLSSDKWQSAPLIDWTSELHDWADTAALIANLDVVISVDTAIAHLAGALGKPVWILSRFEGCWRWLESRDDSPWYPSARLFHQTTAGNWREVIERVTEALKSYSKPSS
ncbi:MAG: tetratricopeptide repeat-containing glycosyltransferase family protein [Cytophagales bacterium]|nr:tetratricopeptide repeat-containing glycosyltransferase family protein [Cytophagales bacterium]